MIFVLPGMGADSGMFTGSWRELPDAVFIDWPSYRGEQTLAEIAARIVAMHDIRDGAVVVGTSLGGMVACEIAKLRRLKRLVLIAGAIHPDEINPLLIALKPLARITPVEWLQWSAASVPGEIAQMLSRGQPDFIRAGIQAVFAWNGIDPSLPIPVRIHGKKDHVISPPRQVDLLLDGGHLVAMTHARDCCAYVMHVLGHAPAT